MFKSLLLIVVLAICLITVASAETVKPILYRAVDSNLKESVDISLDTQEDMIAYDSAPAYYLSGLMQVGTQFSVRFTPPQPCTLTYIQVVSYPPTGPGNALIHVWDDNSGVPGTDLIDPFTVNLNGSMSYQTVNLPTAIGIGSADFYVGVEYTQTPPPFVTSDADGPTEYRSKYKAPDSSWSNLINDLNFRAFVNYYVEDQVPPTIEHQWQIFGFTYDGEHVLSAEITDGSGISSATIHYSLDGDNWETVNMSNTSGDTWEGAIPIQEAGTTVLYYLTAVDDSPNSNEATEPPTAPDQPYIMEIIEGSEIAYDDGTPEAWYIVDTIFSDNALAIEMTPENYPVQVTMTRAYVSGDTSFNFTLNEEIAGVPGDILPGGEAVSAAREEHGWAIAEWIDGPTITSGSFFLVFHWQASSPDNPGVGKDQDNVYYRSYWYNTQNGWNVVDDGEWIMRTVIATATGIYEIGPDGSIPVEFQLVGNYPNPFNPSTSIEFLAPINGDVCIEVYNIAGQLVKTVFDGTVEAGVQTVNWNATDNSGNKVTSGVYFYKLTAGNTVDTKKMVLVK